MIGLVSGVADPYRLIHTQRMHLFQELHDITEQRSQADPGRELAEDPACSTKRSCTWKPICAGST